MKKIQIPNEEEKNQVDVNRSHVVILGAGASKAAFPQGDKNGRILPLMNDFIEVLDIEDLLTETKLLNHSNNFEEIYNELCKNSEYDDIRNEIETKIYEYFRRLELPNIPTVYDHLLLSLRKKDCIASFNWDPLLVQAYRRNGEKFDLPYLFFLHGNVAIGYCKNDDFSGTNRTRCPLCNLPFKPTNLLFPIMEKNYDQDGFLSLQWRELSNFINAAFMLTFFGYSAPKSDVRAIELMELAWGRIEDRNLEQIEIIDIKSKDLLKKTWKPFIHTHHFEVHDNFYDSWIANHPRRTGEAYKNQYILGKIIDPNPIPKDYTFNELWNWLEPYQEAEKNAR